MKELDVETALFKDMYQNQGKIIPGFMCWAKHLRNYWQFFYNYEVTSSLTPYIISLAIHNKNKIVKLGAGNRKTENEFTNLQLLQPDAIIPNGFRLKGVSDTIRVWLCVYITVYKHDVEEGKRLVRMSSEEEKEKLYSSLIMASRKKAGNRLTCVDPLQKNSHHIMKRVKGLT